MEKMLRQATRGAYRLQTELRQREGVPDQGRETQRAEEAVCDGIPMHGERLHQPTVSCAVASQPGCCLRDGAFQHNCRAIIQWMCKRRERVNPFQSVLL